MSRFLIALALCLVFVGGAAQRKPDVVSLAFEDHGGGTTGEKDSSCKDLSVRLQVDGQTLEPEYTNGGFVVPNELRELNDSRAAREKEILITVACEGRTLQFQEFATWVSAGSWTVGIDYPPLRHFVGREMPEKGYWVSYLVFESTGGEGVVSEIFHSEAPSGMIQQLSAEQQTATGKRARDVAYALAVFNENYQQNRDALLRLLRSCLSRTKGSPDKDGCDEELLDDTVNLYWRGDSTLLRPLLEIADRRSDVIDSIGAFYGTLLDRQPAAALLGLRDLDSVRRELVCELAGEDEFRIDAVELERVHKSLTAAGDEVAISCLHAAEEAAAKPWH